MIIASYICFALSLVSILGSIAIWNIKKGEDAEEKAHAERFGIFVGLWAPTFLGIAIFLILISQSS
ncbi:MAG: hypothetical protein CMO61_07770 [Verrucomicrobiales bacterium]|mgnify:CR=1 FL=1|jgi:uncharacterized Tic20 family protein|nr:hypothetical protein [Verrucomicrobiales bacterium]|tara:strand:+ start:10531 stop:10728 length:198 start_codon:yes stop_codon:yes gene_type:complete